MFEEADDAARVLGARRLTAGCVVLYITCARCGMSLRVRLLNLTNLKTKKL